MRRSPQRSESPAPAPRDWRISRLEFAKSSYASTFSKTAQALGDMFTIDVETDAGRCRGESVSSIASHAALALAGNTVGERDANLRGTNQTKRFAIGFWMEDHRLPAPLQMSFDHLTIGVQREVNYLPGCLSGDLHAPGIIRIQNRYAALSG